MADQNPRIKARKNADQETIRGPVREILAKLGPAERRALREWAESARGSTSYAGLVNARTPKAARDLLKAALLLMKEKAWTDRSWGQRAGLLGVAAFSAAFAGRVVGLRALRWGLSTSAPAIIAYLGEFFAVLLEELAQNTEDFS